MSKNIDILITCCKECPYCRWYELFSYFKCKHKEVSKIIEDITTIRDDCPLKEAGVRVSCTIMVVRDKKILLGKRGEDCEVAKNLYAYPGGRMDYGENPERSAVRELEEETGLIIKEENLYFLRFCNEHFPENGKHYVSLVFMARFPEGEPIAKKPEKCKGWEWFDPNELPEDIFWAAKESIEMFKNLIVARESLP